MFGKKKTLDQIAEQLVNEFGGVDAFVREMRNTYERVSLSDKVKFWELFASMATVLDKSDGHA